MLTACFCLMLTPISKDDGASVSQEDARWRVVISPSSLPQPKRRYFALRPRLVTPPAAQCKLSVLMPKRACAAAVRDSLVPGFSCLEEAITIQRMVEGLFDIRPSFHSCGFPSS